MFAFTSPLAAKSVPKDKQKIVEVEKEPDFIFLPKAPHFDRRMK